MLLYNNSKQETILKDAIQENVLAIYLEEEQVNYIPSKDSGYTLDTEKSSCTNGATVSWDNDSWRVLVNFSNYSVENMSRTKCTMYFKKDYPIATDYIISLADSTNELVYDETIDNNLRYIGANPNNYVSFNNELWRIIGVFHNIDNGSGTKESRLKIIRGESIGEYSWDNYGEYGKNDWTISALQRTLNSGAYWNQNRDTCPYGNNGGTTLCDFSNNGFTNDSKQMISDAVWTLNGVYNYDSAIVANIYTNERHNPVSEENASVWLGKIGLMYPSDYGYATAGGNNKNRNACLEKYLADWSSPGYNDCLNNNWLNGLPKWTLTLHSKYKTAALCVSCYGPIDSDYSSTTNHVFPNVYLNANTKIKSGTGTENNPYVLAL